MTASRRAPSVHAQTSTGSSDRSPMAGDATLFAREDYVEEAWRIVDPVLKSGTPVLEYAPNTWGPKETDSLVSPPGGWDNLAATP